MTTLIDGGGLGVGAGGDGISRADFWRNLKLNNNHNLCKFLRWTKYNNEYMKINWKMLVIEMEEIIC